MHIKLQETTKYTKLLMNVTDTLYYSSSMLTLFEDIRFQKDSKFEEEIKKDKQSRSVYVLYYPAICQH